MLDFLGEISSGPRFIYMAFPWIFSKQYRAAIREEYQTRNKFMAWLEFTLAIVSFLVWLILGLYIVKYALFGA